MNVSWETLTGPEVVATALRQPGLACLTCSFQLEDMVVLQWLRALRPDIPVLFLDTGYHFPATYVYRDRMATLWRLNLHNLQPAQTVTEQQAAHGLLYRSDPAACCRQRKVAPLMGALSGYQVWFTGLRRQQAATRASLAVAETQTLPSGHSLLKVSPLAAWSWEEVEAEAAAHGIEPLPLYAQGFTSIGCEPCTTRPAAGAGVRSGRWGGAHTECGIHTAARAARAGQA